MATQSFPVVERGRFVWIWMGDPQKADDVDVPPAFEWENEPGFVVTSGDYEFDANYFLLQENVLDLTHFNYVHANSFGIKNWNPTPEYSIANGVVELKSVLYPNQFPTVEERQVVGLAHPSTIRSESLSWMLTPACHFHEATVYREENQDLPQTSKSYIAHLTTPAGPRHTYYWWLVATDNPMPEEAKAGFAQFIEVGYREDQAIMEAIQDTLDRDPRGFDYPEVTAGADGGGMLARQVLSKMLQAEREAVET
jgi:vanillate O-demethylase monooxygenase subunit